MNILGSIEKLLCYLQKERINQKEKVIESLNAINEALIQTKQYIEFSNGIKCFDREKEYLLSRLWSQASTALMAVRDTEEDFPTQLHEKSIYWSSLEEWSSQEVERKDISIDSIERKVTEMIKKHS